eukprot:5282245-Ditylum_brightwellii.AAC.1
MPGSDKTNKTGPSTLVSPNKNAVSQEYDESTKSSSQNTAEHSGLRAQQEGNKQKYSNLIETLYFKIQTTVQMVELCI